LSVNKKYIIKSRFTYTSTSSSSSNGPTQSRFNFP
jgi:hypothetical protein